MWSNYLLLEFSLFQKAFQGRIHMGFGGSIEPLRLKISFSRETLDTFYNFRIPYLPQIFTALTFYRILLFNQSILLPVNVCKIARWVANSVDPPWSDAAFCGVWSGSTLFAQACLSQYVCRVIWSTTPVRNHPGSASAFIVKESKYNVASLPCKIIYGRKIY